MQRVDWVDEADLLAGLHVAFREPMSCDSHFRSNSFLLHALCKTLVQAEVSGYIEKILTEQL